MFTFYFQIRRGKMYWRFAATPIVFVFHVLITRMKEHLDTNKSKMSGYYFCLAHISNLLTRINVFMNIYIFICAYSEIKLYISFIIKLMFFQWHYIEKCHVFPPNFLICACSSVEVWEKMYAHVIFNQ